MPRRRLLHPLPLSHVYGALVSALANVWGWTVVLLPRFEVKAAFEAIEKHRCQRITAVPTMLHYLLHYPERGRYDTSSLEHVLSGGAPLAAAVQSEFEHEFHVTVHQGYGMSETMGVGSGFRYGDPSRPLTAGRPLPGLEVQVHDFSGQPVAAGMEGEIVFRGRPVTKGYWHRPEETKAAFRNGWLLSGDIGHLDAEGFLYITDRKKDLIIKGGENISPREIEETLLRHPAVAEVCVVGAPDAAFGEVVGAAVVRRAGSAVTAEELNEFAGQTLNKFKLPSVIRFVEALPKSPVGKLLKREVRREMEAAAAASLK